MNQAPRFMGYDLYKLIVALLLAVILLILLLSSLNFTPFSTTSSSDSVQTIAPLLAVHTTTMQPMASVTQGVLETTETVVEQPEATATREVAMTINTNSVVESVMDCPTGQPSRLEIGDYAYILYNLNLREEPGLNAKVIDINIAFQTVEVVGGPICTSVDGGAYMWWQVKTSSGLTGWSAEAPLSDDHYFLRPDG